MGKKVAILGASDRHDRYAYKAFKLLSEYGHQPFPVHPQLKSVEGVEVYPTLNDLPEEVDTLTMYVNPTISTSMQEQILKAPVKRVIFNPGTENPTLEERLRQKQIEVVEACTLIMLRTGAF